MSQDCVKECGSLLPREGLTALVKPFQYFCDSDLAHSDDSEGDAGTIEAMREFMKVNLTQVYPNSVLYAYC